MHKLPLFLFFSKKKVSSLIYRSLHTDPGTFSNKSNHTRSFPTKKQKYENSPEIFLIENSYSLSRYPPSQKPFNPQTSFQNPLNSAPTDPGTSNNKLNHAPQISHKEEHENSPKNLSTFIQYADICPLIHNPSKPANPLQPTPILCHRWRSIFQV